MKRASVYDWKAAEFAADESIRRERPVKVLAAVLGAPLAIAAAAAFVVVCAVM